MTGFFAGEAERPKLATLEEENENAVPRDRWQRPLIVQPDGRKVGYNRASSFGGQIEDKTNVEEWTRRQVVRGIAMHPELLNAVPLRMTGDPWIDMEDQDKKALSRISDQAQEYAGSSLKSALGTDIHAATEYVDLGDSLEGKFDHMPDWRRELLVERGNAYHRAVRDWGLTFDSVEQFGVQDEVQVAGTWDRRGAVPWWPEHGQVTMDVKTSSTMLYAGIGFAVQLGAYAHMSAYDPRTAERVPHEDMDHQRALIIHVDRNKGGPVELFEVDIANGWEHAVLARQIILARREGKKWITQMDERKAAILSTRSRQALLDMSSEIKTWPSHLRELANQRWAELS